MSTQDKLAETRQRILEWIAAVAANGSLSGAASQAVIGMFDKLQASAAEAAQAQVQDAKDADTTDQTAIVDSAGNIKYVHVEIFNAMKARAEEAEAMFFKATQDAKDAEVYAEIDRTTAKFPTWPTDPLHAVSVLGEEYGELVKATLQHTYEPHKSDLSDVREEAIQTAAMALRFARSIDRYEFVRCKQHSQDAEMAKESGR